METAIDPKRVELRSDCKFELSIFRLSKMLGVHCILGK